MSGGKPDFGQKIGPLPMGAWVALVGGGIGLFLYHRNSIAAASAPTIDPTASLVGTGGAGAVSGSYIPTDGGSTSTGPVSITTNQQWGSTAFSWLAALGMAPDMVDAAIRNYLDGNTLSVQENAIVSQALGKFGQPPESLPSAPPLPVVPHKPTNPPPAPRPAPKPAPRPVTKPPTVTRYKVQHGDTLSGIAAKFRDPRITWQSIFNANKGAIHNPNLIYSGQNLIIA